MSKYDNKYAYSTNGEDFFGAFSIREEAMNEGLEGAAPEDSIIYTAEYHQDFYPSICAEDVLDALKEIAYDTGGDYAEDYLYGVTKEQIEELEEALNEVLTKWLDEHGYEVNFYSVDNIEEVDIAEYKETRKK